MGEIKKFNKLVRDKIPEIIEKNNTIAKTKTLSEGDYKKALKEKFYEEIEEFYHSDNDINELADIKEVFNSICIDAGYSLEEVEKIREEKANKRGGFNKKIFLIETIEND